ncbi:MAG: dicarboxylate/amino acid:cation symporter [Alphaproteobacteria bacterium]|nr:dicarboxylate/amino acid:cation symporter [Alphaproteobacteria bacterium]
MSKSPSQKDSHKESPRGRSLDQSAHFILDHQLWVKILSGMLAGIMLGLILSPEGYGVWDKEWVYNLGEWLALPGVLFLGLIQMVIMPLIICSIILGIAESGNLEFLRTVGLRIIPYFIVTTAIAIIIGMVLVNTIRPGDVIDPALIDQMLESGAEAGQVPGQTFENLSIPDRIANLIPSNPARAQVDGNMLQIVIAAILVGIALISIPKTTAQPLKDLCVTGQVLSMKIISWAMMIAPFAVFGLLANVTIRLGLDSLLSIGLYALTVLAGLLCVLIFYMLLIVLFTKQNPLSFLNKIREVQLLAFSTSSSAATIPFSIHAAEEKLQIRPQISRIIIPLGATINMDGTALYQGVAALFLCQVFGIELDMSETILLIATTVGASIGTPATPGVGLIVLATILTGIGVPPEGIAMIIGVDRILDMCRTTVNVTGDLTASAIVDKWIKD